MKNTLFSKHAPRLSLLMLFALLAIASSAATATATSGGLPPALGKPCGHASGAGWHFHGQTGTEYNVTGLPAAVCAIALKSVEALTKQTPKSGALGAQTLVGPYGFRCAGSGIKLAHAGFCGNGGKHFLWAPRLK